MWHNLWQKITKTFKSSLGVISVITLIIIWSVISYYGILYGQKLFANNDSYSSDSSDTSATSTSENSDCNVTGINLHGDVVTYNSRDAYSDSGNLRYDQTSADEVTYFVKQAQDKENIKAIAVEIDSSGGSGEAGEEMMRAFKDSKKPVVALIRNRGLSAAYLAATGAQTIFASKFSDVGSIGITMSYLQDVNKNTKDGLTYIDLSSGPYKDSGNPARALTDAEKQLFMRDVGISFDYFVQLVAKNRNLSVDKVKALADGSSIMGQSALVAGLIDKLGILPDVENYLTQKIGEKANICWQN